MNLLFWTAYFVFAVAAVALGWHDSILSLSGPLGPGKLVVFAAFLAFLAYSIRCSLHENLFATIAKMSRLWWGRQIGADLYLGLSLTLFLIYLHKGALVLVLWLIPALTFVNLATLLFVSIYYDSLVARFAG
jgi:hypothetical protein